MTEILWAISGFICLIALLRWTLSCRNSRSVAFFHPLCFAGGGGERVLWTAIGSLQSRFPGLKLTVYTADCNLTDKEILLKAKEKFSLDFKTESIKLVRLKLCWLMQDTSFPRLTLLLQSLGMLIVGIEACLRHQPGIVIDTIGAAFSYPAFYLSGSRVFAYVHYPFISGDMLERVRLGTLSYNNSAAIGRNPVLKKAKLIYYQGIFLAYRLCGFFLHKAMVNSKWTRNHMKKTWRNTPIELVYPPCDVCSFQASKRIERKRQFVSLAQFRPEKNHELQLNAFALLKDKTVRLILVGGARDDADRARVEQLRKLAVELGINKRVSFEVDAPFKRIQTLLWESLIGLHTMTDEHFGISVVEFMIAGLVTIANNSGGPKEDIVEDGVNGFLAESASEYAKVCDRVLQMEEGEIERLRQAALLKAQKSFSQDIFVQKFASQFAGHI